MTPDLGDTHLVSQIRAYGVLEGVGYIKNEDRDVCLMTPGMH